ncbi:MULTISPECIES: helix-turn-helix domain-containing protein [Kitasatospora]|uniref:Helix-turn-helix domain-containing protein n=1 Tax=Kitasatospora cathayae TaxID=3004092 RepID=A0ABY7QCA5_9ACTN|nr:helix-turn-helix domain-containing protein [Kitasatospora sp. HUAS 3-15]WBP90338.1 helix-turn-helix domain-containing protein [Kitasatospora sp. HUAS 3-15]
MTKKRGSDGTFAFEVLESGGAQLGFDLFRGSWEAQVDEEYPAPAFAPGAAGDFRISVRAVKVHDLVIADVRGASITGTNRGTPGDHDDRVLMHVVRPRLRSFSRSRASEVVGRAGNLMLQRGGLPASEEAGRMSAKVLIMPASVLGPLIRDRLVTGSVASAEARLLLAHMSLVSEAFAGLTPGGARAAHDALIELVKGLLRGQADSTEPQPALVLAQAAKELVDRRVADAELSPSMLASELNVSLRTLHRAFAAAGESVAAYVRRRRLEQARSQLAELTGQSSVSEIAAQWHFADSSHFIRAFKRQYGQTPGEFARQAGGQDASSEAVHRQAALPIPFPSIGAGGAARG